MERCAVYMATRNLYQALVPAVYSLAYHTHVDRIFLMIEDDRLPRELPVDGIEIINVSRQTIFPPDGPNYNSHWTYMVLLRAALARILPGDVDRVLSLDTDTIVLEDIGDVWDIPMDGAYMAMVRDVPWMQEAGRPYFNAGVCLHNLALQRDGTAERVVRMLNERKLEFAEQDAFNEVYGGRIRELPQELNVMPFAFGDIRNARILHYAGLHNYDDYLVVQGYRDKALDAITRRARRRAALEGADE